MTLTTVFHAESAILEPTQGHYDLTVETSDGDRVLLVLPARVAESLVKAFWLVDSARMYAARRPS